MKNIFILILLSTLTLNCSVKVNKKNAGVQNHNPDIISPEDPENDLQTETDFEGNEREEIELNKEIPTIPTPLPNTSPSPTPTPTPTLIPIPDITEPILQLIEDEMFKYNLNIQWPKKYGFFSIYLNGQKIYANRFPDINKTKLTLQSGIVYSIIFYKDEGPNSELNPSYRSNVIYYQTTITTPIDVHLNSLENLQPFTTNHRVTADRVFITEPPITTNGFSLFVRTKKLISTNGLVQTFAPGAKASISTPGRNGGSIQFYIDQAFGKLDFITRGENGGDGNQGPEITERAPSGIPFTFKQESESFKSDPSNSCRLFAILKENGKIIAEVYHDGNAIAQIRGKDGSQGTRGQNGFRGGDTGFINLKIKNETSKNPFNFTISKEPGLGGNGGPGGLGQLGGLCGPYEDRNVPRCQAEIMNMKKFIEKNTNNTRGPNGINGTSGENGNSQQDCVVIGDQVEC